MAVPPVIAIAWLTYQESRGEPTLPVDEDLTVRLDRRDEPQQGGAGRSVRRGGRVLRETQPR